MKNIFTVVLFALLVFVVSCNNKKESKKSSAFSEIQNYFESEITALDQSDLLLTKMLIHEGKAEQTIIESPDWSKELVPFTATISNQPAQIQSYNRDSIMNGFTKILLLTAKDASASIRSVTVYSTEDKKDSIVIIKQVHNSYYSSSDTLTYYGLGNYLIKAENLPGIGKKIGFILEGKTTLKK